MYSHNYQISKLLVRQSVVVAPVWYFRPIDFTKIIVCVAISRFIEGVFTQFIFQGYIFEFTVNSATWNIRFA